MIGFLEGKVMAIRGNKMVIMTSGGVGYEVGVVDTNYLLETQVDLHVYTHVRENSIDLYGFSKDEQKTLFEMLIGVNGVGPKMALSLMQQKHLSDIVSAISQKDPKRLKVSGLGVKTSEKIIIELDKKIKTLLEFAKDNKDVGNIVINKKEADVKMALSGLGYSMVEIEEGLEYVDNTLDLSEIVKKILVYLKK